MSDYISIDTGKLAQVSATQVKPKTFRIVPEGEAPIHYAIPEFDFSNPPVNPNEFASSLVETCIKNKGLGLSANQCGFKYRVFVAGAGDEYVAYFNPRIVSMSRHENIGVEGCLSFPNLFLNVLRPQWVEVEYQDFNGVKHTTHFYDMTARILTHEIDHMNGITFIERTKPLALKSGVDKRNKLMYKMERAAKSLERAAKGQRK